MLTEEEIAALQESAPETPSPVTAEDTEPPKREQARFTEVDLNRVRQQEKDKLYPQINELKEELSLLRKEREDRQAAERSAKEAAEAETRRKAEEEMDVRQLLQAKEQEWAQRMESERQERERAIAMLEQERKLAEVQNYRLRRIEAERDNILPELIDLVSGNSPEEVEESIAGLRARTERILESAQGAIAAQRGTAATQGTRVTLPPAGPLDASTGQRTFTPDEIRNMSTQEYAKYRGSLIGNPGEGQGLFG